MGGDEVQGTFPDVQICECDAVVAKQTLTLQDP